MFVLFDAEPPLNHLWEVQLGGVSQKPALGLEAEPVRKLPLGPSSDDPSAYLGPRKVRPIKGGAHLLRTNGEGSHEASLRSAVPPPAAKVRASTDPPPSWG